MSDEAPRSADDPLAEPAGSPPAGGSTGASGAAGEPADSEAAGEVEDGPGESEAAGKAADESGDSEAAGGPFDAPESTAGGEWDELGDCFLTIWVEPRATIRRIVAVDARYWVLPLASLGGGSSALYDARSLNAGNWFSLSGVLILSLVVGPILGVLSLYVGAWAVRVTGEWFLRGRARSEELRVALAWSHVPGVAMLPLLLLATAALPGLYQSNVETSPPASIAMVLLGISGFVMGIWSLIISANGVAEVQGYRSAWKGLWNLLLPGVLIFGIAAVVGVVVAILVAVTVH